MKITYWSVYPVGGEGMDIMDGGEDSYFSQQQDPINNESIFTRRHILICKLVSEIGQSCLSVV